MNYQGEPCKDCGEVIEHYCRSGYCRKCWHKRRGGKSFPGSRVVNKEVKSAEKMV